MIQAKLGDTLKSHPVSQRTIDTADNVIFDSSETLVWSELTRLLIRAKFFLC